MLVSKLYIKWHNAAWILLYLATSIRYKVRFVTIMFLSVTVVYSFHWYPITFYDYVTIYLSILLLMGFDGLYPFYCWLELSWIICCKHSYASYLRHMVWISTSYISSDRSRGHHKLHLQPKWTVKTYSQNDILIHINSAGQSPVLYILNKLALLSPSF